MPPPITKLAVTIHVSLTLRVSKKPKPRTYGWALDAPIIEGEGAEGPDRAHPGTQHASLASVPADFASVLITLAGCPKTSGCRRKLGSAPLHDRESPPEPFPVLLPQPMRCCPFELA